MANNIHILICILTDNYMFNRFNFLKIYNLFSLAAEDIPEFYPNWVKEHKELKKYKNLTDIVKTIPIENYREEIKLPNNAFKPNEQSKFKAVGDFVSELVEIILEAKSMIQTSKDLSIELKTFFINILNFIDSNISMDLFLAKYDLYNELSKIISLNKSASFKIKNKFKPNKTPNDEKFDEFEKTINFKSGESLYKSFQMFAEFFEKFTGQIDLLSIQKMKDITKLQSYKNCQFFVSDTFLQDATKKASEKLYIVFSKDPKDIMAMSARSKWTSCQNILKEKSLTNTRALYSTTSPYVGIIYLTNGQDFQNHGEEMIARSQIFYVKDKNKNGAIFIGNIYTNFNTNVIMNKFTESLKKHSSLPVTTDASDYYFPEQEEVIDEDWESENDDNEDVFERDMKFPYFDEPQLYYNRFLT